MADESILFRMESTGGEAPRLRLRALGDEEAVQDARGAERYERVGEIARGGVGIVHKGRDVDLGRDVAVKVLRQRHLGSPDIVQRFVEEAQIGGQLQHPGIVPVYELGIDEEQRPFFAMKLVKGETLAALLDGRQEVSSERRKILAVFEQACRTVAYAHSRGVVHRDLKPANIMVGAFGEVQVVDWGFAKVLARGGVADERRAKKSKVDLTLIETVRSEGEGSDSVAGSVFGTPAYMPPEQALGHVEELDERSDVFALGAILCEILTGEPPYSGSGRDPFIKAAMCDLGEAHERLAASEAAPELLDLCRQALSPVPKDRPRNAAQIAEAISSHLSAAEERAHRSHVKAMEERERAAKSRRQAEEARAAAESQQQRKKRTVVIAAAALLLLLLAGGAWFTIESAKSERRQKLTAAVEEAMQEASRLRGAGELNGALAAASRAADLAAGEDATDDLREQAEGLQAEVRDAHAAAEAQAARIAADEAFVAELEAIRLSRMEGFDSLRTHADYAAAFRRQDIDIDALTAEEVADRIRGRTDPLAIVAALDDWASLHMLMEDLPEERAAMLLRVTRAADPDEWRNRLRDAVLARDHDRLLDLAEKADFSSLPVRTLDLLAQNLGQEDALAAVAVLRRAVLHHPGDLWLTYHLSHFANRTDPPLTAESLRYVTAALAISPGSAQLWVSLGMRLGDSDKPEAAQAALWKALELVPDNVLTHSNAGAALNRMGLHEESERILRKGLEIDPSYVHLWTNLSATLANLGRFEEALKASESGLELSPNSPVLLMNHGISQFHLGMHEESVKTLRTAASLDRQSGRMYMHLMLAYLKLNQQQAALDSIIRATEAEPGNPVYLTNRGWLLCKHGKYEEAIPLLRRALELANPTVPVTVRQAAHASLGTALNGIGDLEGAVAEYRKSVELKAGATFTNSIFAETLWRFGHVDAAVAAFQAAKFLSPGDPKPRLNYGALLSNQLKQHALAELEFREAIRLAPDNAMARFNFGQVLIHQGRQAEGIAAMRKAISLDPAYYKAQVEVAFLVFSAGKFGEAAAEMEKALAIARDMQERGQCRRNVAAALFNHAGALREKGEYAQAMDCLRRVLEFKPGDPRTLNALAWNMVTCPDESALDMNQGLKLAKQAIDSEPENPHFHCTLGLAHFGNRQYDGALAATEKAIALGGGELPMVISRIVRAMALFKLGQEEKSREALWDAVERIDKDHNDYDIARIFRAKAEALILGK